MSRGFIYLQFNSSKINHCTFQNRFKFSRSPSGFLHHLYKSVRLKICIGNSDIRRMNISLVEVKISIGMIKMSMGIYQHERKIRKGLYCFL